MAVSRRWMRAVINEMMWDREYDPYGAWSNAHFALAESWHYVSGTLLPGYTGNSPTLHPYLWDLEVHDSREVHYWNRVLSRYRNLVELAGRSY